MKSLLIIDTASAVTSVALSAGDEFLQESDPGDRRAAQAALPMISRVLERAQLSAAELDAIAVVTGPGSFTGIRIGIGIAQGLCLANGIPAIPLSTMAWYAQAGQREFGSGQFAVVLPARHEEVYLGLYQSAADSVALLGREQVAAPGELRAVEVDSNTPWTGLSVAPQAWPVIAGSLGIEIESIRELAQPLLQDLLQLARAEIQQGRQVEAAALVPNYVKEDMQYG